MNEYVLVKLVYHNNITTDNNGQSNCSLIPPMKQYKVTINLYDVNVVTVPM